VDTLEWGFPPLKGVRVVRRKKHSEEFKVEAVRLLLNRGDRTVAEIAENLGVNANQLHRWRTRYEKAVINPGQHARETAEQAEIRRLKKEVDHLKMEREILKKATAFFAKESR
jgi:transposase